MRRIFWLALGLGAGVTAAVLSGRWLRRQRQAMAPSNLARQASASARDLASLLGEAAREFRAAKAEREAEVEAMLRDQEAG